MALIRFKHLRNFLPNPSGLSVGLHDDVWDIHIVLTLFSPRRPLGVYRHRVGAVSSLRQLPINLVDLEIKTGLAGLGISV